MRSRIDGLVAGILIIGGGTCCGVAFAGSASGCNCSCGESAEKSGATLSTEDEKRLELMRAGTISEYEKHQTAGQAPQLDRPLAADALERDLTRASLTKHWDLTKGDVLGISIGSPPGEVIDRLKKLGAHGVLGTVNGPSYARTAQELDALRSNSSLVLYPSYMQITFKGDIVDSLLIPPAAANFAFRDAIARAKTRTEIFTILKQVLDDYHGAARVDRVAPEDLVIQFATASAADTKDLMHMTRWLTTFRDKESSDWTLWLCFSTDGRLERLTADAMPPR